MADNTDIDADSEAKKWFVIAVVSTLLYVSAVFAFVLGADVDAEEDSAPRQSEVHNGQSH